MCVQGTRARLSLDGDVCRGEEPGNDFGALGVGQDMECDIQDLNKGRDRVFCHILLCTNADTQIIFLENRKKKEKKITEKGPFCILVGPCSEHLLGSHTIQVPTTKTITLNHLLPLYLAVIIIIITIIIAV